ncbi:Hypothetical Protein FCC1311_087222 [Hondaea fermentalgiana]|uniref:RING-type domain-containing protein n=1 Tax=Hondaea fermentalgiana TaxID=2315210 RepID=A0A2R5GNM9_9STRA|nr:Hypothetical Protein FCC1311_087222 [Hondaea fermentalgiana]|eukprot:GBG32497.1 Hypothetical Protein FCC1311_087222 [Hondaea fermentalgiana]
MCRHIFCRQCVVAYLLQRGSRESPRCPACLAEISVYSIIHLNARRPLQTRAVTSIYGTSYRSSPCSVLGDLHFDQNGSYMSNLSVSDPLRTLSFDDGTPLPSRTYFENWYYNEQTRTFEGTLDFGHGCKLNKAARIRFKLIFQDSFAAVQEGEVKRFDTNGSELTAYKVNASSMLRFQRIKTTIYEDDSIFYLELQVPWIVSQFASLLGVLAEWVYGMPVGSLIETMQTRVPAASIGLGSFHFSPHGSYVDFSRSRELLAQGMPRYVRFMRESFDPMSRIFEGAVEMPLEDGPLFLVHYHLVFDPSLSKIVDGKHEFYQVLRPLLSRDVLTQKFSNIAQSRLYLLEERHYGFGGDSILRFRALSPWQDILGHTAIA